MSRQLTKSFIALLASFFSFNAHAISTEAAELRTGFVAPIDNLSGGSSWGETAGVSIRFNASSLPTKGVAGRIYDWGLSIGTKGLKTSTDGKNMNCEHMDIYAAFRTDGMGQQKFVTRASNSRNTCAGELVVHDFDWREGQTYELTASRDSYVTERTSAWNISVKNLDDHKQSFSTIVMAKNNLSQVGAITHLENSSCGDSDWQVNWSHPAGVIDQVHYRLGRLEFYMGELGCATSSQDLTQTCGLQWTHQMGGKSANPRGGYPQAEQLKEPMTCRDIGTGIGTKVGKAYVNAIASGGSTNVSPIGLDFGSRKCSQLTVWGEECQKMGFNGLGGKIYMMNAITPVGPNDSWQNSNIKQVIPEVLMRRIMTDAEFSDAKSLLGYISNPDNNWFPWLQGKGQAKDILRQYMHSMK